MTLTRQAISWRENELQNSQRLLQTLFVDEELPVEDIYGWKIATWTHINNYVTLHEDEHRRRVNAFVKASRRQQIPRDIIQTVRQFLCTEHYLQFESVRARMHYLGLRMAYRRASQALISAYRRVVTLPSDIGKPVELFTLR